MAAEQKSEKLAFGSFEHADLVRAKTNGRADPGAAGFDRVLPRSDESPSHARLANARHNVSPNQLVTVESQGAR